jgi:hypothetical protein
MDRKVSAAVLAAGAVSLFINQSVTGEVIHLPTQAPLTIAATSTGSIGAVIHHVPDTIFDRTYEARYSRLAPEVEASPERSVPRST